MHVTCISVYEKWNGNISILFEGQEVIFSRNMTSDINIVMELLEDHMPRCVNITKSSIEKWAMQNVFNMWVKGIFDDNKSFLAENRFHFPEGSAAIQYGWFLQKTVNYMEEHHELLLLPIRLGQVCLLWRQRQKHMIITNI